MIHRLAISIGTIAAAAVLAIGFAATGFGPAAAPVDAGQLIVAQQPAVTEQQTTAAQDTEPAAKPITKVKTKTIYVKPAPKPKVIHVTKRDKPAPAAKRPKVKVVKERPAKHADDRDDDDEDEDHEDREDKEDHERDDEHEDEHEDDD